MPPCFIIVGKKRVYYMKKILILCALLIAVCAVVTTVWSEQKSGVKKEAAKLALQQTCAIIKPDAVEAGYSGQIITLIELNGFEIVTMEKKTLTKQEAETFYAVHQKKEFFKDLVAFMTSGPVIVMKLKRINAISAWRELMGATNPAQSSVGTLRAMFGTDVQQNATHGSDSEENAQIELAFFFPAKGTSSKKGA